MEEEKKDINIKRKISIRKKVLIAIICIFVITSIIIFSLYIAEKDFRNWIDLNLLRKNVTTNDVPTIDLDINKSNQICVYSKYIALLNEKKIVLYNSYGEKISEFSVDINNAIFDSSNKYLAVAENGGKNLYLLQDTTYLWSGSISGEIKQIHVNQNGYVGVVTTDSTYKAIVTLYSPEGKEMFKKYLSSTRVIDISISKDNKYLALAEVDTSGTLIQSNVEVVSIESATSNKEDAKVYYYSADKGKLITKIKYQDKNKIVCMYDSSIQIITNHQESEKILLENSNITYASVNLSNCYIYVEEEITGIFKSNSILHINSTISQSKQENTYHLDEVAKEVYTYENVIAVNVGSDVYFINENGWLIKKFSSKQEITNVSFSNNLAAVIYKDRIEIINL